ncbi:MAG: DUF2844 domain-containing protein [Pseudomonadota bacterium]|jgi:hypothetical protein|nr:DUF2844 domain-containing protein [Pseudomonadota bacterium]
MKSTPAAALVCAAVLYFTAALAPAQASLGQRAASVNADLMRIKGQIRLSTGAGYRVDEITTPQGTVVKEFISPADIVFAVSWRGPVMPNLAQTLGSSYFGMLTAAERQQRALLGHNHVQLRTPQLVVHAGGHMRQFFGVAYVPSLLPPNVTIADLH